MKNISETIKAKQLPQIFTIIKPGFIQLAGNIISKFESEGFRMSRIRTTKLTLKDARRLYAIHKSESFYDSLCKYMSSDVTTAIIFDWVKRGKDDAGKDIYKKVGEIKDEIREKYGESDMRNVMHSSDSEEHMEEEKSVYFYDI